MAAKAKRPVPPLLLQQLVLLTLLFYQRISSADDGTGAPMDQGERRALYAAIEGFVGDGWNGSTLYPDPCGWSPIQGVTCDLYDGVWRPTAISVGPYIDNSLPCAAHARFSPALFELKQLKTLSFYSCFTGAVVSIPDAPAGWSNLAGSLLTLEFRGNPGLSGPIPAALGVLASLQSLVIVDNARLAGTSVPPEIGHLRALRRLVLSGNGLSGEIPATLGAAANAELLILDLSSNKLNGRVPASLGGLTSLLKLDLSNNNISGGMPLELAGLKSLTLLDLRSNSLTGGLAGMRSVQEMPVLQDLLLCNNPLVGGSLESLDWPRMTRLTTVDLANLGLTGPIPKSLTRLSNLRLLALDHNHLVGAVPAELAELPELRGLYLHGNNLTGRLGFNGSFFARMGRRFASWDNPGLCYDGGAGVEEGRGPAGVEECAAEAAEHADDDDGKTFLASLSSSSRARLPFDVVAFVAVLVVVTVVDVVHLLPPVLY